MPELNNTVSKEDQEEMTVDQIVQLGKSRQRHLKLDRLVKEQRRANSYGAPQTTKQRPIGVQDVSNKRADDDESEQPGADYIGQN